jgi:hypothetical protein
MVMAERVVSDQSKSRGAFNADGPASLVGGNSHELGVMIRNPFDNVGMLEKELALNERTSLETLQRKTLNVRTL